MRKFISCLIFLLAVSDGDAQTKRIVNETAVNNLLLPPKYKTTGYGEVPEYSKAGNGKQALVLIPGLGFDASVFSDFIEANKSAYTIYCITIPGFGKTHSPEQPPEGTSFGQQRWNNSVLDGICKLIDREKMEKPVIVGHFTQGALNWHCVWQFSIPIRQAV